MIGNNLEWITTENTHEETWRRLLEYANIELAYNAIEKRHGKATKNTKKNYLKQAEQIRVSLLQAKEYFEASKYSSLMTQPNHLYYGSVALTTACMLLLGGGNKSLDLLRKDNRNSHHGLNFTFSSNLQKSKENTNLLENSFVQIFKNGHFFNWYSTLKKEQSNFATFINTENGSTTRNFDMVGHYNISDFESLVNKKYSLIELINNLPDLQNDLNRFEFDIYSTRGQHKVFANHDEKIQRQEFIFHSAQTPEVLDDIISNFIMDDKKVKLRIEKHNSSNSCAVAYQTELNYKYQLTYPDSRFTLDNDSIYFKDPFETPEVIDLFMINFALSMMSRYYPDIWVSFLESHCIGAKLVERLVRIFTLKIPFLVLNQMSSEEITISNHKPPWHVN